MHEFGSQFDWYRKTRISNRMNTATDPVPRFEDRHVQAGFGEALCSREPCKTGTNNQYRFHGIAPTLFRRAIMTAVKTTIALLVVGMVLAACSSGPAPTMQSKSGSGAASTPAAKPPDESAALDGVRKTVEA